MIPGSANSLLLASATGAAVHKIERSLRFNSSDSAYLSRTPASAGNRKTWTLSLWVKRGASTGSDQGLFSTYSGSNPATTGYFNASDGITFYDYSGAYQFRLITSQVFRDYSAWYHLVFAVDTTQATPSDRVKLYVNGIRITTFSTETYPTQNLDTDWNSTVQHDIGYHASYFNGYLADIHFIDGQALDPTSFGEFDTNGVWQPIAYTGTYGTNGFHLDFADNSAATTAGIGKDVSNNGNNWTPNNLSVASGAGNDSLVDTPTSYGTDTGAGGEVRGNYATLNPLHSYVSLASNGNLDCNSNGSGWIGSTIHVSTGKWYTEFTMGSTGTIQMFGVCTSTHSGSGYPWQASTPGVTYYASDGRIYVDGVNTGVTTGSVAGDIISLSFDVDAKSVVVRRNNSVLSTKTIGTTSSYMFYISDGGGNATSSINFGQRPFAYTAPSGFKALCDTNLPAPVVAQPSTVMDVVLYTGTGSTLTPTSSLGFNPDLVWIKSRSAATDNTLYDAVRGAQARLESNTTDAEVTSDNGLTAFNSNGFTLGTLAQVNTSSATYAGWCWDAGSSTVTNTDGSITSQVRANASAGFSIVTYTGTGASATVGHGLGVTPRMIIVKRRDTTSAWPVYHRSVGGIEEGFNWRIELNTTAAGVVDYVSWNGISPTSTVFSIGASSANTNVNGGTYVAYCFAPVDGYSSFGSYTGNGSSDGPFVYTGFRPRWVMIKGSSTSGLNWCVFDTSRDGYNGSNASLHPNASVAESYYVNGSEFHIYSNGFRPVASRNHINNSGTTFIWAAFAESPFKTARAR